MYRYNVHRRQGRLSALLHGIVLSGGFTGTAGAGLARFFDMLWLWDERARQRRALARLDDRLLGDIGLSRADAAWEGGKPFWRA